MFVRYNNSEDLLDAVEPVVDEGYEVFYDDSAVMVVGKSGQLPVSDCGRYRRHTLVDVLRRTRNVEPKVVHRIDKETSGLVVLTKSLIAARSLSTQFAEGTVGKVYHAVLDGMLLSRCCISYPIARFPGSRFGMNALVDVGVESSARVASTVVTPLLVNWSAWVTYASIQLLTGRTHQIRVHCASIGHAVVGDKLYRWSGATGGPACDVVSDKTYIRRCQNVEGVVHPSLGIVFRHLLHAKAIRFQHPITDDVVDVADPRTPLDIFSKDCAMLATVSKCWGIAIPQLELS